MEGKTEDGIRGTSTITQDGKKNKKTVEIRTNEEQPRVTISRNGFQFDTIFQGNNEDCLIIADAFMKVGYRRIRD